MIRTNFCCLRLKQQKLVWVVLLVFISKKLNGRQERTNYSMEYFLQCLEKIEMVSGVLCIETFWNHCFFGSYIYHFTNG